MTDVKGLELILSVAIEFESCGFEPKSFGSGTSPCQWYRPYLGVQARRAETLLYLYGFLLGFRARSAENLLYLSVLLLLLFIIFPL